MAATNEPKFTLAQEQAELECAIDALISDFEERTGTVVRGLKVSHWKGESKDGKPSERTEVRADVRGA